MADPVEIRYSDFRVLDAFVWRPHRSRFARFVVRLFGVSVFSEVAVYLGEPIKGIKTWFVPGRTSRVCTIPESAARAVEIYVIRPRGYSILTTHVDVFTEALDMASEDPGFGQRCVVVDTWANFALWLPFKVDSVLRLWGMAFAGMDTHVGRHDDFESLIEEGVAEEIGREGEEEAIE